MITELEELKHATALFNARNEVVDGLFFMYVKIENTYE